MCCELFKKDPDFDRANKKGNKWNTNVEKKKCIRSTGWRPSKDKTTWDV
jgi:hypothetical protein